MEKLKNDDGASEAVAGPFTVRDLTVGASALVIFVGSLIPYAAFQGLYGNLWNSASLFFLGIGAILPIAVVTLFVARRFSPRTRLHIGSLSVDQFASVAAVLATVFYFLASVTTFTVGFLISLVGALGLLAATVLGPHLRVFAGDFTGRAEAPAHLVARAAAPARKKAPVAKTAADAGAGTEATGPDAHGPEAHGPQAHDPEAHRPEAHGPEAHGPEAHGPEAHGPAQAPAASAPDKQGLAAQGPAAQGPDAQSPDDTAAAGSAPAAKASKAAGSTMQPAARASERTGQAGAPADGEAKAPEAAKDAAPAGESAKHAGQGATPATTAINTTSTGATSTGATSISATRHAEHGAHAYEAFWFAVAQPRDVVDESTGKPAFTLAPGAWILALEDRGEEFLVQNTDGRIGVLRDLRSIERA